MRVFVEFESKVKLGITLTEFLFQYFYPLFESKVKLGITLTHQNQY